MATENDQHGPTGMESSRRVELFSTTIIGDPVPDDGGATSEISSIEGANRLTNVFYREFSWLRHPRLILKSVELMRPFLDNMHQIDEWVRLIRQSRHPQLLWESDYIYPTPTLQKINHNIRETDSLFFNSPSDAFLREGRKCDKNSLALFNVVRAYLWADDGNLDDSKAIWDHMFKNSMSDLSLLRRTNLLAHLFAVFMCCKRFEDAMKCLRKQWALLKLHSESDRYNAGIWDNLITSQLLMFFFVKNVPEYLGFLKTIDITDEILLHRKNTLFPFLTPDLIMRLCSKSFYDYARTLMPTLPDFPDTLIRPNSQHFLGKEPKLFEVKGMDEKWTAWHKEIGEKDHSEEVIIWLDKFEIKYESVIDLGCGTSKSAHNKFQPNVVGVDCSSYIVNHWEKLGRKIVHCNAEQYFENAEKVDLCFCSDALQYFKNADKVLAECSQKCRYLCCLISCDEIGFFPVEQGIIKTVETCQDKSWWLDQIEKNFNIIKAQEQGSFLLVLASSQKI